MKNTKTAKLFMSSKSQAVRLPKMFRMDGQSAHVAKVGSSLVLSPIKLGSLGGDGRGIACF